MTERHDFLRGMIAGLTGTLVGGAAVIYLLTRAGIVMLVASPISNPGHWLSWAYTNLGLSIPVFALLLIVFFVTLGKLKRMLETDCPVNQIVQLDNLTDIWTTLFFGTGVIWTAIGMRSALIFALGDRDAALSQGAFAMLERMIDGGILLALSTTIVGGIGGYLMRVYKTMSLGAELTRHYDRAARADTSKMRRSLKRIEKRLGRRDDLEEVSTAGESAIGRNRARGNTE